jgi:hypothetical protein
MVRHPHGCHRGGVPPADLLRGAVERTVLAGHEGKSGAGLERVRLVDGRVLVVKRVSPADDLTLRLTGGTVGREHLLRVSGAFDRLPPGVGHALVDSWVEEGVTVLVMRDLGDRVLTWDDRLDAATTGWVIERVARLHRAFLGSPPPDLAPLDLVLMLFAPARIAEDAEAGSELMRLARRGWEIFADTVPADVADPVAGLLADATPLAEALAAGPVTLAHGDLATVNMAVDGDDLLLLDWAMPTAAPGALDLARFLAGCASVVEPTREQVIAAYADAAGPAYDDRSLHLALLAALVWLGWNKALDAAEHPDPAIRTRERADLDWWVGRARAALESGAL